MRSALWLLLFCIVMYGCAARPQAGTVTVGAGAWRNMMPTAGEPRSQNMLIVVRIDDDVFVQLPASEREMLVRHEDSIVWRKSFASIPPGSPAPRGQATEFVVRDGPEIEAEEWIEVGVEYPAQDGRRVHAWSPPFQVRAAY